MKVSLMGYMGSGKSAIGKALSKQLNIPFIDLDDYIIDQEKLTINAIFERKGELYFRKKETLYLETLLQKKASFILSLGGGTPCYGNNLSIITKYSTSFYLKATLSTLYQRLSNEMEKRPILKSLEDPKTFISKHLFERQPFYQGANHTVEVDNQSIDFIVNQIITKIDS